MQVSGISYDTAVTVTYAGPALDLGGGALLNTNTAAIAPPIPQPDRPPVLAAISGLAVTQGSTATRQVSATDPDGDAIVLSISGNPSFVTLTDNGGGSGTITASPTSSSRLGAHTVTVTATANSRTDSESFTITVSEPPDTTPPSVTPPADRTFEATAVQTPLTRAQIGTAGATDNVDSNPAIRSNATSTFPLGETLILWTATDSAGNSASAKQTITVRDTTPPVITPPADVTIQTSTQNTPLDSARYGTASATDIFSPVRIANNAPSSFPPGNTTVTWTATDPSGNTATATQTVTLVLSVQAAPSVVLSRASGATPVSTDQVITATFDRPVAGFESGDIAIANATVANFTQAGSAYTFVANTSSGATTSVTVSVPANVANGTVSGLGNTASNTLSFTVDKVPPTFAAFAVSGNRTLAVFSEPVSGAPDLGGWTMGGAHPHSLTGVGNSSGYHPLSGVPQNGVSGATALVFDHAAQSDLRYVVAYNGTGLADPAGNVLAPANATVPADTTPPTWYARSLSRTTIQIIFDEPVHGTLDLREWRSAPGHAISADGFERARTHPLPVVTERFQNLTHLTLHFGGTIGGFISYTPGTGGVSNAAGSPLSAARVLIPQIVAEPYSITHIANVPGVYNGIHADGDYLYPISIRGGAHIADISNKTDPSLLPSRIFAGYAFDVDGDHAYMGGGSNKIWITDVSNKMSPSRVGEVRTANLYGVLSIDVEDGHAYVGSWDNFRNRNSLGYYHNYGMSIVDVSNKTDPVLLSSITDPRMSGELHVDAEGNYAYAASRAGLTAIDISNKT